MGIQNNFYTILSTLLSACIKDNLIQYIFMDDIYIASIQLSLCHGRE